MDKLIEYFEKQIKKLRDNAEINDNLLEDLRELHEMIWEARDAKKAVQLRNMLKYL